MFFSWSPAAVEGRRKPGRIANISKFFFVLWTGQHKSAAYMFFSWPKNDCNLKNRLHNLRQRKWHSSCREKWIHHHQNLFYFSQVLQFFQYVWYIWNKNILNGLSRLHLSFILSKAFRKSRLNGRTFRDMEAFYWASQSNWRYWYWDWKHLCQQ